MRELPLHAPNGMLLLGGDLLEGTVLIVLLCGNITCLCVHVGTFLILNINRINSEDRKFNVWSVCLLIGQWIIHQCQLPHTSTCLD